ncbi:hypothetical protein [Phormidium nigroviride]
MAKAIASPNPQKCDRIQQLERQIEIWETLVFLCSVQFLTGLAKITDFKLVQNNIFSTTKKCCIYLKKPDVSCFILTRQKFE